MNPFGEPSSLLVITSGLGIGGAETMLVNIVNRLDRNRLGTQVVSLSPNNPLASAIRPDAARLIRIPRRWRYDLAVAGKIRQVIEDSRVDTVLCFSLFEFFFVRLAVRGLKNPPHIVISIHATRPANRKDYLLNWTYARFLTGSESFISICEAQADYWSVKYRVPRGHFTTIYNGVNVDHFRPPPEPDTRLETRERWAVPADAYVFIQVARFHPCKRHESALDALRLLRNAPSSIPVYLMLVGGGAPDREIRLRRMASDLGISDRVIFCGIQSDVRPFYTAADAFTLTSVEIETFSVAALEAMAMGLPVVLTDVGGSREMLREGVNGYLLPTADPSSIAAGWRRALEQRHSFDADAIRRLVVQHYSIETCAKRYEDILCSHVQGNCQCA